ncbi:helix-turn-helix transcriptional regulator [Clostridium beijerinckii]|uniref:helix-turn-helix transcriptional regulator n=1 Tax=Clostridium beijerinckii TaxID=1520 RepID=UPI00156FE53A|nr:helix-turn-helix transcriptional regulator [Clostridium beijerinckii]NRU52437.1 transcriptional regulator with XRE-family HTH domain [Clostridium beijerinckii]NYC69118.1 transcriptional regulator with XRE-family HTH domain [Clostridium beijerinckii]NYC91921.1 transcriptional regulator with XRE-family HTH domain [Clostridium beijerinckii]
MGTNLYTLYIKKYRKNLRHMTQEELAYKCGVAPSYISMLEQDNITRRRSPSLALVRDLAYSLEICPNDILIFRCSDCKFENSCNRKQYVEEDNEDFYKDNLIYYL